MLNTHFQGKITEIQVAKAFLELGYQVSQPLVPDSRYDFIVDIKGKLFKIQVKTSHLAEDKSYFEFATSTSHTNTKGTLNLHYSEEDVDFFAFLYKGQCYLVPYNLCGKRTQRIRFVPTKNGQIKGILFAKDFYLEDIVKTL